MCIGVAEQNTDLSPDVNQNNISHAKETHCCSMLGVIYSIADFSDLEDRELKNARLGVLE